MVRTQQRILVIGDRDRQVEAALAQAAPRAEIVSVESVFDGIAELSATEFETVLAPAEPIERRPDAAVRTLREAAGDARLVLFGDPTLEPVSRKMLEFGLDDYIVTPAASNELIEILKAPVYREVNEEKDEGGRMKDEEVGPGPASVRRPSAPNPAPSAASAAAPATPPSSPLNFQLNITAVLLDALLHHPADPPAAAVAQLNRVLAPARVALGAAADAAAPGAVDGMVALSQPVAGESGRVLYLQVPAGRDEGQARQLLGQLAELFGKLLALHDRNARLQKLAITDELTGLANARWFRHFLSSVMETSRKRLAPVTLLLFDIDDFKKYNDRYGHAVGDEILKQTAQLMKRSVREHDLVARIGGDEFAVVFWEKEGPRTPRDPHAHHAGTPGRPPQTPQIMCDRFRRLLAQHTFSALGSAGQGTLTISGGLATFPWNGQTPDDLIKAADHALMFGAKKSGKNSIALVGEEK